MSEIQKKIQADINRRDETTAKRCRIFMGRNGWILSWYYDHNLQRWIARLSCAEYSETIEGIGESRCKAIENSSRILADCLIQQRQLQCQ